MKPGDARRLARQWLPFAARTVAYGSVSLALGPFTRDHRASLWAMREWSRASARGLDLQLSVEGTEHVPGDRAFVYVSNHQSIVDILVLGALLPGDFKWAAKRSMLRVPFLGWHLALAGHVPVDRGRGRSSADGVVSAFERVLAQGKPLLVFPEGTRTPDGALKPFKSGAFRAAVRTRVPVVPVAIDGTFGLMRKGASDTGEGNDRRVRVRIGPPLVSTLDGTEETRASDLRDRAHAAVSGLLGAIAH